MERSLTYVALFAALIAVLGLVPKIDLISGVPISAQSMGIMLCGTVLGAKRGVAAVLLLLAMVALGLPLLSGGRGGLGVFVGPTAGYLVGWVACAFTAGLVVERWKTDIGVAAFAGAFLGGMVVLTICGIIGMALVLKVSLPQAAMFALPFVPGDFIKCLLAAGVTRGLARLRPEAVLSRA